MEDRTMGGLAALAPVPARTARPGIPPVRGGSADVRIAAMAVSAPSIVSETAPLAGGSARRGARPPRPGGASRRGSAIMAGAAAVMVVSVVLLAPAAADLPDAVRRL